MNLTTNRLAIREFHYKDLEALYKMYSNPAYQRYESPLLSIEKTRDKLEEFMHTAKQQPRTNFCFAVATPPVDTLIGIIVLRLNNSNIREWEIGWGIHPNCWGQGFAPEAAKALVEFAFKRLDAHRVVAFCHAGNHASTRVMDKIGMVREAHLRETRYLNGQWWDEFAYAILQKDYEKTCGKDA